MVNGTGRLTRRFALASVAAALLVGAPSGASAATQIGQTIPNPDTCGGDSTYIQTESPGPSYAVPSPGVIKEWSYQAASNPPPQMKFKVGQLAGGDNIAIVGESGLETIVPNSLNSFPTRIPVQAGDLIGFYISDLGDCSVQDNTFTDFYFEDDVLPGATEAFIEENYQLDISAELEPYRCGGKKATIVGTTGRDRLVGTRRSDVIVGLEGNDKIKGGKGKDRICGGRGKDKLKGGPGKDKLDGGPGKDKEIQ